MQFKKIELHLFVYYVHMYQRVHVDVCTPIQKTTPPENHVLMVLSKE